MELFYVQNTFFQIKKKKMAKKDNVNSMNAMNSQKLSMISHFYNNILRV